MPGHGGTVNQVIPVGRVVFGDAEWSVRPPLRLPRFLFATEILDKICFPSFAAVGGESLLAVHGPCLGA